LVTTFMKESFLTKGERGALREGHEELLCQKGAPGAAH